MTAAGSSVLVVAALRLGGTWGGRVRTGRIVWTMLVTLVVYGDVGWCSWLLVRDANRSIDLPIPGC